MIVLLRSTLAIISQIQALPRRLRVERWNRDHQRGVRYAREALEEADDRTATLERLRSEAECGEHFDRGNGFDAGILSVTDGR